MSIYMCSYLLFLLIENTQSVEMNITASTMPSPQIIEATAQFLALVEAERAFSRFPKFQNTSTCIIAHTVHHGPLWLDVVFVYLHTMQVSIDTSSKLEILITRHY